jgi:hypothetical protein
MDEPQKSTGKSPILMQMTQLITLLTATKNQKLITHQVSEE